MPASERNETRHSRIVEPKTQAMIGHCAAATASLVAAITPDVARGELEGDVGVAVRRPRTASTSSTIRSTVAALWSSVNSITGITLQSELSRPVDVGT